MDQSGSTLLLAIIFYSFQIYADFSGYSDMAIGVGKLLGFNISRNFNYPYFALNIADFWRRWHISLTTWVTDYVFTPLNFQFRRRGKVGMILAIFINMLVVGLWHGANWTFVLFGVYHGLLFVPLVLSGAFMKKARLRTNRIGLPILEDLGRMLLTYSLVLIGCIIVRSGSVGMAWEYICGICNGSLFTIPLLISRAYYMPKLVFAFIMFVVEWLQKGKEHGLEMGYDTRFTWLRFLLYLVILLFTWIYSEPGETTFIYFQF
jgi:D-alanyl-lipoteichoic acid acyltransferase DltB (MBOAT superfamily)